MRLVLFAAACTLFAPAALAQTAPAQTVAPAPAVTPGSAATTGSVTAKYSTAETQIGTLLDDPAAKAIVEKHIPGMTTNDQIDMARGMTLKAVQQYAPDDVTDERLAAIDADFAKLPK